MQHSEALDQLATALAAAQGEIENATKNASNPAFRSKYADLAEILNTVRPVLAKHGLSVVQLPGMRRDDWNDKPVVSVQTMLLHKSGQWIGHESAAPVVKADPQGVGSAVTYLRRYSLAALCAIAQEDDDGHHASQRREAPTREPETAKATAKQTEFLAKLMGSHVFTDAEREKVRARVAGGDKDTVSAAIAWAQDEMAARKAVEAQEAQPAGAS